MKRIFIPLFLIWVVVIGLANADGNDSYTVLLVQSEASDGSTTFTNTAVGSTEGHSITGMGGAHHETDAAKFGQSSLYFNGSTDYLRIPDSVDFEFSSSNFTIDCWVKTTDTVGELVGHFEEASPFKGYLFGIGFGGVNGAVSVYLRGSSSNQEFSSNSLVNDNQWHHVAFVRSGTSGYFFIDGNLDKTVSITIGAIAECSNYLLIARDTNTTPTRYFQGFLEEVRISKNIARWTSSFTPPTDPYSTNTPTPSPSPTITPTPTATPTLTPTRTPTVTPTPDVFGNDPYCVLMIHSEDTDGSTAFTDSSIGATEPHPITPLGSVHHETDAAKFGQSSIFFNGTSDYLRIPDSVDFEFGSGNFTLDLWVKTTDTVGELIGHFEEPSPFLGFLFGIGFSGYLGNLTVYLRSTTTTQIFASNATVNDNLWHHVAFVRSGNNGYFFIDGQLDSTVSITLGAIAECNNVLLVGRDTNTSPTRYFQGYIEEVRISKGIARWTTHFTPPDQPYYAVTATPTWTASPTSTRTPSPTPSMTPTPTETLTPNNIGNDYNCVLLIESEEPDNSTTFLNTALGSTEPHPITTYGSVHHETDAAKFGSSSIYFDGVADYLRIPDSVDFEFGAGDFTIDLWVKTSDDVGELVGHFEEATPFYGYLFGIGFNDVYGKLSVHLRSLSKQEIFYSASTVNDNQWHHVAFVRSTNTGYFFIDGHIDNTVTLTLGALAECNNYLLIGRDTNTTPWRYYEGFMEEVRISKGVARWTADFTPPTLPYLPIVTFTPTVSPTVTLTPTLSPTPTETPIPNNSCEESNDREDYGCIDDLAGADVDTIFTIPSGLACEVTITLSAVNPPEFDPVLLVTTDDPEHVCVTYVNNGAAGEGEQLVAYVSEGIYHYVVDAQTGCGAWLTSFRRRDCATMTPTLTPTLSPSCTSSPTLSPTLTPSLTPTYTFSPTATLSPTVTSTLSPTLTATATRSPTETPTQTATASPTESPTLPPTESPTLTASATPLTPTEVPSWTSTLTPTNTESPTLTPTASATLSPTPSPEPTETLTPTHSPTFTPTESPTMTASLTSTPTATDSPTHSPTATATLSPSSTNSPTESPLPSPSPTEPPTDTPTITFTPTFTISPTLSASPTITPSLTPTPINQGNCSNPNEFSTYSCASETLSGSEMVTEWETFGICDVLLEISNVSPSGYDPVFLVLSELDPESCLAFSDSNGPGSGETLFLSGLSQGVYYFIVDAEAGCGAWDMSVMETNCVFPTATPTPQPVIPSTNATGAVVLLSLFSVIMGGWSVLRRSREVAVR